MGKYLSLDETSLSNGELYTILTNKSAKGRKGSIIAMIKGVKSDVIISILKKIPIEQRNEVEEVTLDMANSMNLIVDKCFLRAEKVIDRFHVQKLAYEALQGMRIKHRWKAIDEETNDIDKSKWEKVKHSPVIFDNGDTKKQLLARSRYLLFKSQDKWSENQKQRAKILFSQFPDIKEAYSLVHSLRLIFSKTKDQGIARTKLAQWYNKVTDSGFKSFNSISATIYTYNKGILNFFNRRSTNAAAESFNAKLKGFRSMLRGVSDISFFLFRVAKIYA
ncbi:MAG: transposase [Marinifilaceae bacterium]